MRPFVLLLLCALLSGCISQPKTPQESADLAAMMGMLLIASAAETQGSAASVMWQVRIPPPALEVLGRIQAHRRTAGAWPRSDEIALPEGVTELALQGSDEDLAVVIQRDQAVLLRCKILKDGTVVASPVGENFMALVQARRASSSSSMPIFPPPIK